MWTILNKKNFLQYFVIIILPSDAVWRPSIVIMHLIMAQIPLWIAVKMAILFTHLFIVWKRFPPFLFEFEDFFTPHSSLQSFLDHVIYSINNCLMGGQMIDQFTFKAPLQVMYFLPNIHWLLSCTFKKQPNHLLLKFDACHTLQPRSLHL